ncbi:hypothetical protein EMCRGX_G000923 [Ephydatia muelleri]
MGWAFAGVCLIDAFLTAPDGLFCRGFPPRPAQTQQTREFQRFVHFVAASNIGCWLTGESNSCLQSAYCSTARCSDSLDCAPHHSFDNTGSQLMAHSEISIPVTPDVKRFVEAAGSEISVPQIAGKHIYRANSTTDGAIPEGYYRVNVAVPFLDNLHQEMSSRFDHENRKSVRFGPQVKLRADDGEETRCTARFGEKTSKVQWQDQPLLQTPELDEILAVARQQTLLLFITVEHRVLEQAAVVFCFGDLHAFLWLNKLYNTFVGTGSDGPLWLASQVTMSSNI